MSGPTRARTESAASLFIFGAEISPDHQARIDRYAPELTDKLEQVALAALKGTASPLRCPAGRIE